jgi:NAD(P)-dependent dehydrogenase (short-subunit alcohol dehydrogenase family)
MSQPTTPPNDHARAPASPLPLRGATAFVTGGASGIGLAVVRALLREGARVAVADNNPEWLAEVAAELGDAVLPIALDVTDRAGWAAARATVEAKFGPVDVLVNNAGIGPDLKPLDEAAPAYFDLMIAIKLTGTFNGIHEFVPGMKARGRGHVVNTASMAGLTAMPRLGPYTAAKFGVVGLTEVLAAELAEHGVGASVLCPGLIATRLGETSARAGLDRPPQLAAPAGAPAGLDPAIVGDLVIDAIRHNHLHIVTHREYGKGVARRMDKVLEAFERVPMRNLPLPRTT